EPQRVEELIHELCVIEEVLRGNFMTASGDNLLAAPSRTFIQRVLTAAFARSNVDRGTPVTIEQLAALARVTERTVRAATSTTNPNPLPITKDGHWTYIEARDARAWLSARRDFRPTRTPS